ncbi:MAG: aminomethyl-transferring glycine dehydrogenase subunit GcvPA [Actinomycetota bacterium]
MTREPFVHPYIPNSAPDTRRQMLLEIGVEDVEELYEEIPERLRFKRRLDLPEALPSEPELRRHVEGLLARNQHCEDYLSFLGGGCWQHSVPAVCDEIMGRSEFISAYSGSTYPDLGKYQARFEFQSQMAELLDMDDVADSTYDWGNAAGQSLRMTCRITGRNQVVLVDTVGPERLAVIRTLCGPPGMPGHIDVELVGHDPLTGFIDLADLERSVSSATAAVYIENPSYLGFVEPNGAQVSSVAHAAGALSVVGVDPISLGVLTPPSRYGADIVCGELQSLGMHLMAGGCQAGFMAFRDEEAFVSECPLILFGIAETIREGELAFGEILAERTSYGLRDKGRDWVGTSTGLYAIGAGVYLSLMGPQGMREIGETIIQRAHYASDLIEKIDGLRRLFTPGFFKEFVINFDDAGTTVKDVNRGLLDRKIFGGKDLSTELPGLGQSALFSVTEVHAKDDLDRLADALSQVTR